MTKRWLTVCTFSMFCFVAMASISGPVGAQTDRGFAPARAGFVLVHRRADYHCHRRYGYRHYCHQGERSGRDEGRLDYGRRDYGRRDEGRRYYGRPYYPRRSWRRRSWPREYHRRRYDRDRPYWRRHPYNEGPSVYQAI